MRIGMRHLGGQPRAFYDLTLDEQVDVLAVLGAESEAKSQGASAGGSSRVVGKKEAAEFWGF